MKKISKAVVFILVCAMAVASLAACGKKDGGAKVTVTFMNGDTELGKATATSGKVLSKDDYSKFETVDGFEFNGWYATSSFKEASAKDLTKDTFDSDIKLYGDFKNTNVTEDTRKWYIVGESTNGGPLKGSAWADANASDEDKANYELKATGSTANEFSITIDLFKDDKFQIIHDWQWEDQHGMGAVTECDAAQIEGAGGLGENANIGVLADGNYTITLTTDPDNAAQDTLVIVRNGDVTAAPSQEDETTYAANENTKVIVKGSWVEDWSDHKELTRGDGNTFSITMDMTADTEFCFSVFDGDTDTGIVLKEPNATDAETVKLLSSTGGNNLKIGADGTYTLTVNLDDNSVVITK